ncbi:MAG: hypothetical protein EBX40_05325 [Gammaproteobacteria bacterium]|nr:hypothetical protein [Gammaproteobacteria bacterium]
MASLKVLTAMEGEEKIALLCELPKSLANRLNIGEDGSVDLISLLEAYRQGARDSFKPQERKENAFNASVDLMRMIYDRSLAVDA